MSLKPIYIKKSMKDINAICKYDIQNGKTTNTHVMFANKAYTAATKAHNEKDEERAYILYMRYLDAYTKIRKSTGFQKDRQHYMNLLGSTKVGKAMENAEELAKSLEYRYQELEAKEMLEKKKSESEQSNSNNAEIKTKTPVFQLPTEKLNNAELYKLLIKDKRNIIMIDVRSSTDFNDSHIQHGACINIPSQFIKPGTLSSKVEEGISEDHYGIWSTRDSADLVVLLDWHSNLSRLDDKKDPLRSLKDSIWKWEQKKILPREPVILEGGYTDFLDSYPQFTTNPNVKAPREKAKTGNVNSLLEFSYDNLKEQLHPKASKNSSDESEDAGYSSSPTSISNPEIMQQKEEIMKEKVKDPFKKDLPSVNPSSDNTSAFAGLYPDISSISKPQKSPKITLAPVFEKPEKVVVKNKPVIDRSVKPTSKPEPKITPSEPQKEVVNVKVIQNPKVIVPPRIDVPKKPPINSNDQNEEDETLAILQKKMEQMKLEKEEKRKNLAEIERKKRCVEMQAEIRKMESENKDLDKQQLEAQKNLANTMRGNKPKTAVSLDKKIPTKPIETTPKLIDSNADKPLSTSANSQVVKANEPMESTANSSKQNEPIKPVVTKPTIPPSSTKPVVKEEPIVIAPDNISHKTSSTDLPIAKTLNFTKTEIQSNLKPITKPTDPKPALKRSDPNTSTAPIIPAKSISANDISTHHIAPSDVYASVKKPLRPVEDLSVIEKPINQARSSRSTVSAKPQSPVQQSFGGGSLKRSRSSPNINKLVNEERTIRALPIKPQKPQEVPVRATKPSANYAQPSEIAKQFRNSLQGLPGTVGPALTGLRNLGNTCYMNSVLQCLFNTTPLAEYVLTNLYRKDINCQNKLGYGGRVAECFAVLLREIWSGQWRYLVPSDFKAMIGSFNSTFAGYSQEDSQEFLLFLLDGLHEDFNKTSELKYAEEPDNSKLSDERAADLAWKYHKEHNDSIILGLFKGQFKGIIKCLSCGEISRKFDAFVYLSLPLPQKSTNIHSVIESFSAPEKMEGSNQWDCPRCKRKRDAVRKIEIWKLPAVLIVHFKRFECSGQWRDKIHTNVSFPLNNLNINKFCGNKKSSRIYDLYSVSHHQGAGLDSGHYVATCKNVIDNSWYHFDDTEVTKTSSPRSSTAFLLFYSSIPRIKPRQVAFNAI